MASQQLTDSLCLCPQHLPGPDERQPGIVLDTFVVRRTPYGWRIESPELPDRVLGSAVLSHPERFPLRASIRDRLKSSMSRDSASAR